MIDHQISDYGVGHILRSLDPSRSTRVGISLNLNDIALLSGQLLGDSVKSRLGIVIEGHLGVRETDFGIRNLRILVEVGDGRAQLGRLAGRHLRRLIGLIRLGGGLLRRLIGLVRGGLSLMDARLCTSIYVLDIAGVLGRQLVELVQAVFDRRHLPIDPLLAGERVEMTPKAFIRCGRQGFSGSVGAGVAWVGRRRRWGSRGRGGSLRKSRETQGSDKQDRGKRYGRRRFVFHRFFFHLLPS